MQQGTFRCFHRPEERFPLRFPRYLRDLSPGTWVSLPCHHPVPVAVDSPATPTSPLPPGRYFYELDETSVRPGYPKLISDVWGIEGPIDAAFTRINCQGKTYLFKVGRSLAAGLGVLPGQPAQPPTHPVPSLSPSTHTVAARYPQTPVSTRSPRQTHAWGCTQPSDPPSVPHPPRAASTGALMTEPWTLGTPATSQRVLKASRTTWTQPLPSPRTATTAMRESISSRVRGATPHCWAAVAMGRTPLQSACSPANTLCVLS